MDSEEPPDIFQLRGTNGRVLGFGTGAFGGAGSVSGTVVTVTVVPGIPKTTNECNQYKNQNELND